VTFRRKQRSAPNGFTLVEIAIVVGLIGLLLTTTLPATRMLDHWSISRAARITERHLAGVRLRAVAHRERLRVRVVAPGTLETVDATGAVVDRVELARADGRYVDSVRIRPRTLGFNTRGHGAAGSVYLYRGDRGIRVVSNFVGRLRRHSFRP
jgi:prepilin-type N-terminal cleavage/methylation domain-containing protein